MEEAHAHPHSTRVTQRNSEVAWLLSGVIKKNLQEEHTYFFRQQEGGDYFWAGSKIFARLCVWHTDTNSTQVSCQGRRVSVRASKRVILNIMVRRRGGQPAGRAPTHDPTLLSVLLPPSLYSFMRVLSPFCVCYVIHHAPEWRPQLNLPLLLFNRAHKIRRRGE